jgi:MFS family permease
MGTGGGRVAINLCYLLGVLSYTSMSGARLVMSLYAIEMGAQPLLVGALIGVMQLMPLAFSMPTGLAADRHGTRWLMTGGFAFLVVAMALVVNWPSIAMLFVVAGLNGVHLAINNVALQQLAGALSAPEERARNFSNLALTGAVSNLLGPMIGGVSIDQLGYHGACGVMLAIALAGVVALVGWGGILPKGSQRLPKAAGAGEQSRPPIRDIWRLLGASALTQLCTDIYIFYLPVYARSIGLSATVIGTVMGAYAVAIFIMRAAMPALHKSLGETKLLTYSFILAGAGFAVMPLFTNPWLLGLVSAMVGLGNGSGQPLTMMMVVARSREGRSGEMLGLQLSVNGAGRAGGPFLMGAAGSLIGIPPMFIISCALMGVGALLSRGIPPARPVGRTSTRDG